MALNLHADWIANAEVWLLENAADGPVFVKAKTTIRNIMINHFLFLTIYYAIKTIPRNLIK